MTETIRLAAGATTITVRSSTASGETPFVGETGITSVRIGKYLVPTDQRRTDVAFLHGARCRTLPLGRRPAGGARIARRDRRPHRSHRGERAWPVRLAGHAARYGSCWSGNSRPGHRAGHCRKHAASAGSVHGARGRVHDARGAASGIPRSPGWPNFRRHHGRCDDDRRDGVGVVGARASGAPSWTPPTRP